MARLDRLMDSVGNGTGTTEMATTADEYFVIPGSNDFMEIVRMNIYMQDNGKWSGEKYSADGALTNGITITKENAAGVIHTYTPQPIKVVGHWGLLAGIDVFITDFTVGDDIFLIRWTLEKAGHKTTLDGRLGEFLKFNVRDSLASLSSHLVQVQGTINWIGE